MVEHNRVLSSATAMRHGRVRWRIDKTSRIAVGSVDLTDREDSATDRHHARRLGNEVAAADDGHLHATEPRSFQVIPTTTCDGSLVGAAVVMARARKRAPGGSSH